MRLAISAQNPPVDGDEGTIKLLSKDSVNVNFEEFVRLTWVAADVTSTTKDGKFIIAAMLDNVLTPMIEFGPDVKITRVLDTNSNAINESEGSDVASAATADIWAADGNTLHVTGTVAITSFATAPRVGAWRMVIFDDVLTLTDGANLNLPGDANIVTAVDDFAWVYAETTTLFKVLYFRADGTPVIGGTAVNNNFVFAYDVTAQTLSSANTFQGVLFDTNAKLDGWTHVADTSIFGCTQTGTYEVTTWIHVQTADQSTDDCSLRTLFNGTEVAGSHQGQRVAHFNIPRVLQRTFFVDATAGQNLEVQFAANTTDVGIVTAVNPGSASTPITASITIKRIT